MNPSRKVLALGAFLALTAWANAQVMACCWFSEKATSLITRIETAAAAPMEKHSCCPMETASARAEATTTRDVRDIQAKGHPSMGCKQDAAPVEVTASISPPSFLPVLLAILTFPDLENTRASRLHSAEPAFSFASGPPRYLSLQRILI